MKLEISITRKYDLKDQFFQWARNHSPLIVHDEPQRFNACNQVFHALSSIFQGFLKIITFLFNVCTQVFHALSSIFQGFLKIITFLFNGFVNLLSLVLHFYNWIFNSSLVASEDDGTRLNATVTVVILIAGIIGLGIQLFTLEASPILLGRAAVSARIFVLVKFGITLLLSGLFLVHKGYFRGLTTAEGSLLVNRVNSIAMVGLLIVGLSQFDLQCVGFGTPKDGYPEYAREVVFGVFSIVTAFCLTIMKRKGFF